MYAYIPIHPMWNKDSLLVYGGGLAKLDTPPHTYLINGILLQCSTEPAALKLANSWDFLLCVAWREPMNSCMI